MILAASSNYFHHVDALTSIVRRWRSKISSPVCLSLLQVDAALFREVDLGQYENGQRLK